MERSPPCRQFPNRRNSATSLASQPGGAIMKKTFAGGRLFGTLLAANSQAADVTYERLQHPEPQNWLMNHHDYSAQRFSSLDAINKSNVKNLKLEFAVALGGSAGNESLEATPLVE